MGMTIDEIIAKETEIAEDFQSTVNTHMVSENMSLEEIYCCDTEVINEELERCKNMADYHSSIANTMRKYQKIEQIIKTAGIFAFDVPEIRRIAKVVKSKRWE